MTTTIFHVTFFSIVQLMSSKLTIQLNSIILCHKYDLLPTKYLPQRMFDALPMRVQCWNDGKRSAEKPRAWNNSCNAVCQTTFTLSVNTDISMCSWFTGPWSVGRYVWHSKKTMWGTHRPGPYATITSNRHTHHRPEQTNKQKSF